MTHVCRRYIAPPQGGLHFGAEGVDRVSRATTHRAGSSTRGTAGIPASSAQGAAAPQGLLV
jgi:hypothetical protein